MFLERVLFYHKQRTAQLHSWYIRRHQRHLRVCMHRELLDHCPTWRRRRRWASVKKFWTDCFTRFTLVTACHDQIPSAAVWRDVRVVEGVHLRLGDWVRSAHYTFESRRGTAYIDQTESVVIFLFSSVRVDSVAPRHPRWLKNRQLAFRNGRISARPVPDSVRSSAAFRAKHACTSYGKDLATWRQTSRWRLAPSGGSGEGRT